MCEHKNFKWGKPEFTTVQDIGEDMDGCKVPIICKDCGAKGEETYLFNERTWEE